MTAHVRGPGSDVWPLLLQDMDIAVLHPSKSQHLPGETEGVSDIPPEPTPRKEQRSERCQGQHSCLRRRSERSGDP
jgi:hypothetical protein